MIDFSRSTFTWKTYPWSPDPYYRYTGGFVGKPGQVYHVRFNLEAKCEVRDEASGHVAELFVGAPCRTEYTIASRNLFQIPSGEWRMAFSRESRLAIATKPSDEQEDAPATKPIAKLRSLKLSEAFQDYKIDVRAHPNPSELTDVRQIVDATLRNDLLNARSTYRDAARGLTISVEYPANVINLNTVDEEFQICTGPVIVPDLATWDGRDVKRVFLAHVAISGFDYVEFILQREVEVAEAEREWLDKPRGRDRLELLDPNNRPPGYPPPRPRPTIYNETWELEAATVVMRAEST